MTKPHMYDVATSILAQKLSQVQGVGQVSIGGGANPAVRVDVNPTLLNNMGLSLEDVRSVLGNANANNPKGSLDGPRESYSLSTTDQLLKANQYRSLILAYRNGAAVRISDVATVTDSVEDIRTVGLSNGKPAVLLIISRQPGANIIQTVDAIKEMLPSLQASIPPAMKLNVLLDRTTTIRDSVHDVELTLTLSVFLVVLVVFLFLRDIRATLIPSVAVPVSLIGTFGVMYLCGYTIDNLSLMAMTIATGFVVDDAIVVVENISRHLEEGLNPMEAALLGAKEIGFTVLSISISLIAVFLPILLMSGLVGRLFREFAVTLSVAILISLIISLTTTPMMCAVILRSKKEARSGPFIRFGEWMDRRIIGFYEVTLGWLLRHPLVPLSATFGAVAVTVWLYTLSPTTLFPQQDTGRLTGNIQADQDTSYQAMGKIVTEVAAIVSKDPAIEGVVAFSGGGGGSNSGRMFGTLKDLSVRKISADEVIARLRSKTAHIPGAVVTFQAAQDLRTGGRQSNAQYQYTLQSDSLADLQEWAPKIMDTFRTLPGLADLNSDQQNKGLQASLVIDRRRRRGWGSRRSA